MRFLTEKNNYIICECEICGRVIGVKPHLYNDSLLHANLNIGDCIPRTMPEALTGFQKGNKIKNSGNSPGKENHKWVHGEAKRKGKRCKTYKVFERIGKAGRGGRCSKWRTYPLFLADVGECPGDNYAARRKNTKKPWCKDNFKWIELKSNNYGWHKKWSEDGKDVIEYGKTKPEWLKEELDAKETNLASDNDYHQE